MTDLKISHEFHDKNYWIEENLPYKEPYFRLEKCARIVNSLAQDKECDLLDIGCGPASLSNLLRKNINYHGIDIAIHNSSPSLIESNVVENEINFNNMQFDIVVAAGLFEYVGEYQAQKLTEISKIMKNEAVFVVTYTNFNHIHKLGHTSPYNNIRSINNFKESLKEFFIITSWYPSSYNWNQSETRKKWLKKINMVINFHIPIFAPLFAVNYFFICKKHK